MTLLLYDAIKYNHTLTQFVLIILHISIMADSPKRPTRSNSRRIRNIANSSARLNAEEKNLPTDLVENVNLGFNNLIAIVGEPNSINNAFESAVKNGNVASLKRIIALGISPDVNDNWAIQTASMLGHANMVECLLKFRSVDPSANRDFAIKEASRNGHEKVVKLLLARGKRVHPESDNDLALQYAVKNGNVGLVKILLSDPRVGWLGGEEEDDDDFEEDDDDFEESPIYLAVYGGHDTIVNDLLALRRMRITPYQVGMLQRIAKELYGDYTTLRKDARLHGCSDAEFKNYTTKLSQYNVIIDMLYAYQQRGGFRKRHSRKTYRRKHH